MATIRSSYPTGASQTEVEMGGTDPALYLQALLAREANQMAAPRFLPIKRRPVAVMAKNTTRQAPMPRGGESAGSGAVETPWYSSQGAATRPTGLGAQMIPGMQAQQSLLPPNMRQQSSQFVNPTVGPSMAGVTPSSWQEDFYQKYGYWPGQAQTGK